MPSKGQKVAKRQNQMKSRKRRGPRRASTQQFEVGPEVSKTNVEEEEGAAVAPATATATATMPGAAAAACSPPSVQAGRRGPSPGGHAVPARRAPAHWAGNPGHHHHPRRRDGHPRRVHYIDAPFPQAEIAGEPHSVRGASIRPQIV